MAKLKMPGFEKIVNLTEARNRLVESVKQNADGGYDLKDVLFAETMIAWVNYIRYRDNVSLRECDTYAGKFNALHNVIAYAGLDKEFFEYRELWRKEFGL